MTPEQIVGAVLMCLVGFLVYAGVCGSSNNDYEPYDSHEDIL